MLVRVSELCRRPQKLNYVKFTMLWGKETYVLHLKQTTYDKQIHDKMKRTVYFV